MEATNYLEYYAKLTGPLLTGIRDIAVTLAPSYGEPPIVVHANAQDQEGRVMAGSFVLLTREAPKDSSWNLTVGFQNYQDLDNHIDWNVPEAEFPSLQIPINVRWYGTTRRGARESVSVSVPFIQLKGKQVEWKGKHFDAGSRNLAEAIVKTLMDEVLVHPTPQAVEQAQERTGGRWQKGRRIASHGQGTVFEVLDTRDPSAAAVALKEMRWPKSPTSTAYKRFVREIQVSSALSKEHTGIVRVIDFHIPEDGDAREPYYVMPLAGSTLAKARHLTGNLEGVFSLGYQLADALSAAHAKDVIHRDVKPSNVLLFGEELNPVLADFGICFLKTDDEGRLTKTDAGTVGPDDYAAPELSGARPEDVDGRADIYSLGKVLYYVLSGGKLFPREHLDDPRFDLRKSSTDPRLAHFYGMLERMVAEDPENRFASMEDCKNQMGRALENVKQGTPYQEGSYGGPYSPRERHARVAGVFAMTDAVARLDVYLEEMTRAVEGFHSGLSGLSGNARGPILLGQDGPTEVAVRLGADHLLAIVLPALRAADHEAVERWADKVSSLVDRASAPGHGHQDSLIAAGCVTALFGAVLVGWYRERLIAFRILVDRYRRSPGRFHHLDVFGRTPRQSWPWIVESLRVSQVIGFEARLVRDLDSEMRKAAGLLTLVSIALLPDSQLDTVGKGDLNIPVFPGLMPRLAGWPGALARSLLDSSALERRVAKDIFGRSDVEDFRRECAKLTPVIARGIEYVRSQFGAITDWRFDVDPQGDWKRWCGGEP